MSSESVKFLSLANADVESALQVLDSKPQLAEDRGLFFDIVMFDGPSQILNRLVQLGAPVNQLDSSSIPALNYAVSRGNLDSVNVLLELGADPNLSCSGHWLIDEVSPVSNRYEIFDLLLKKGLDVNNSPPNFEGYNLLVKALDSGDEKMAELVRAAGGILPAGLAEVEEESAKLDLDTLEQRLADCLRIAWTSVRESRPEEKFYFFGVATNSACELLDIFCNTEELIAEECSHLEAYPISKWFPDSEYTLYNAGSESVEDLAAEVNGYFSTAKTAKEKKKFLAAIEGALKALDSEGFFGEGEQRNRIVLMVQIHDADSKEEKLVKRILKRLNSKESSRKLLSLWD